jgi:hypothetical protein
MNTLPLIPVCPVVERLEQLHSDPNRRALQLLEGGRDHGLLGAMRHWDNIDRQLQALETKLRATSGERCPVPGRLGDNYYSRGYL